jgi:uncharacterized surface protein with fasciclin (FAS1) repeats
MLKGKIAATFMIVASLVFFNSEAIAMKHKAHKAHKDNIVETAQKAGGFNRLIKALKFTGLDKTLAGKGPFTVFAPTDAAFAEFDQQNPELLEGLMKTEEGKEKIKQILLYHVVPARVTAEEVKGMTSNKSVNGIEFQVKTADGKVFINDAEVIKPDIKASNGIIHVINKVLVPPSN